MKNRINTNYTFNSARISGVPLPDAHMRNTNPNFSLYLSFHSTNSYQNITN